MFENEKFDCNYYKENIDKIKDLQHQLDNMLFIDDIVNIKASKFFATGVEREDIVQEGLIGLYKAIKSFDI